MGNRDEKPHGSREGVPKESHVVQEFRRRLAKPGPWPQRFRRLAEAIAGVPTMSCRECEELLDLYVDDELQDQPVRQMYPSIWQHLQVCSRCREAHDLLADIMGMECRDECPPYPGWPPIMRLDIKPHGSDPVSASRGREGGLS